MHNNNYTAGNNFWKFYPQEHFLSMKIRASHHSIYKVNHYGLLIVFLLSGHPSGYKPCILFE